jgi:hypothetical protein
MLVFFFGLYRGRLPVAQTVSSPHRVKPRSRMCPLGVLNVYSVAVARQCLLYYDSKSLTFFLPDAEQ